MDKNRKNNKGITLISLIVLIVVLLILASIAFTSISGDESILMHAQNAKDATESNDNREQAVLNNIIVIGIEGVSGGHSFESRIITEATCETDGEKIYTCTVCGLSYSEILEAGHTWNEGEVTTEPTCSEGVRTYTCTVCSGTKTEMIDAIAEHIWNEGEVTTEPTATTVGIRTYTCEACGTTKTETIPAGQKLVAVASIGDYVNYDPTTGGNVNSTNTTYTSVAGYVNNGEFYHGNGYGDQKFSASNYKESGGKWRILNIEEETITLISDLIYEDLGEGMGTYGFYMKEGIGYIFAEEELHRIASIYGHGYGADTTQTITYYYGGPLEGSTTSGTAKTVEEQQGKKANLSLSSGARALTIDDVNKLYGYTPEVPSQTIEKNSNNATYYPTLYGETSTGVYQAQSNISGGYYNTIYSYTMTSENTSIDTVLKNDNSSYWIASRAVEVNEYYARFLCWYSK